MRTKIYLDNEEFLTGITLKDSQEAENNNMALHACLHEKDIVKNREIFASSLGLSLNHLVCLQQTHSSNFYKVELTDKGRGAHNMATAIQNTDAAYTYEPNLLLCCFTADCVPLTFYNKTTSLIGVIHSGWQGTVKEITRKVFSYLINYENCPPEDFYVYIGRALSQEKFEVDEDVAMQYKALGYGQEWITYSSLKKKYLIDNQQVVIKQCELTGIPFHQIRTDTTCTLKDKESFSYRQDKSCGRHLSFIMKK